MAALERAGISMKEVTDKLLADGVQLFADAFAKLLTAVERQSREPRARADQSPDLRCRSRSPPRSQTSLAEWQRAGQGPAALGARCVALDAAGTKRSGSAGSASRTDSWPISSG